MLGEPAGEYEFGMVAPEYAPLAGVCMLDIPADVDVEVELLRALLGLGCIVLDVVAPEAEGEAAAVCVDGTVEPLVGWVVPCAV